MYKLNLTSAYLSDEQEKELFNPESFKKLMSALNEKKEIEDMTESDLLLDTLMQKQVNILNKVQIVDEKCSNYKLTEKGEIIERLIASFDEVETQLDESLEGFEKTDDTVDQLCAIVRENVEKVSSEMSEFIEEVESNKHFVKLEISKQEQYINGSSDTYLVEYSIEEFNGIKRLGEKMIHPSITIKEGSLSEFTFSLIEQYVDELEDGETIRYEGNIAV